MNSSQSLDSNIQLNENLKYNYNKLRINELNKKIEELQFQEKYYIQRNNNILKNIQKNNFNSFELSSKTNKSLINLKEIKVKYQNYLDSIAPNIKNEFMMGLKNNIFIKSNEAKKKEEAKANKFNNEIDFYNESMKIIEKSANDISNLRKKNDELLKKKEEIKKKYLEREKYLKKLLNIPEENEIEKKKESKNIKVIKDIKDINSSINKEKEKEKKILKK